MFGDRIDDAVFSWDEGSLWSRFFAAPRQPFMPRNTEWQRELESAIRPLRNEFSSGAARKSHSVSEPKRRSRSRTAGSFPSGATNFSRSIAALLSSQISCFGHARHCITAFNVAVCRAWPKPQEAGPSSNLQKTLDSRNAWIFKREVQTSIESGLMRQRRSTKEKKPITPNLEPLKEKTLENYDFSIAFAIDDVNRLLRAAFDDRMNSIGLPNATWRIISVLSRENGLSQVELSRRLSLSRVSIGWLIDRLIETGHVERREDNQDRRVWRVFLTKQAQADLNKMIQLAHEFCAQIFSGLTPQDINKFRKSLNTIRNELLRVKR